MKEQDSIQSSRLARMASLAGTGAQVGINYLKYYGRRAVNGDTGRERLHEENAARVYQTFSKLKGGPLKLAQMLSIDRGLLPAAYADQFAQAQYSAPPLSYPLVVRTFRKEFGREPLEIFEEFGRTAAHGASIGQVHRARKDGHDFAVKVQYPGVADSLQSDLRIVKPIALQIIGLREAEVADYFAEVEERLLEETNYTLELERSLALSAACSHLQDVRFPAYYAELSTRRILTMDWVEGVQLDRYADDERVGQEQRDRVGQALWDFYEHQVHQLRIFHADPHPGNFVVKDDQLWALDFGCTKALEPAFYEKQFRFLDPVLLDDSARLEAALVEMDILLLGDTAMERATIVDVFQRSLGILAMPFRHESFDFGGDDFMRSIYELGEANRNDPTLKKMRGARGSAHSIYVHRTYFGLYSLLARLRARVRIH